MDLAEIYFPYGANIVLAGNANATPAIQIGADADFTAIWLVASSTGTFNFQFFDGSTGRAFMNMRINNVNLFGTAQLPFPMLPPYTFKRQGSIQLDVTDTSGNPNTIQIVFQGKKIFPSQQSGSAGQVVA